MTGKSDLAAKQIDLYTPDVITVCGTATLQDMITAKNLNFLRLHPQKV